MTVTKESMDSHGTPLIVKLDGPIVRGDAAKVMAVLKQQRGDRGLVYLDSPGGDVHEAMSIGRLIRESELTVGVGKCASSCVLVLVGGVQRLLGIEDVTGIGLHRLYFSSLSPSASTDVVTARRRKVVAEVSDYLRSMNVTQQLLEMMEAIPPESIRYLTSKEADNLGLRAPDPVWDERYVAREAADRGTTSMEYRQRRARVEVRCDNLLRDIAKYTNCEEATLLGLKTREYLERHKRYTTWVSAVRAKHDDSFPPGAKAPAVLCWRRIHAEAAVDCPVP